MTATHALHDGEEISIDPFEPSDLDALMAIEEVSFPVPWSRRSYEELWAQDQFEIWVAHLQGELVGYFLTQQVADEMEMHTFAVKPELRRRGFGSKLLRWLIARASRKGIRHIFLQVRPSNAAARSLYERLGFVKVAIRRGYYPDNGEDAWVMRLQVS